MNEYPGPPPQFPSYPQYPQYPPPPQYPPTGSPPQYYPQQPTTDSPPPQYYPQQGPMGVPGQYYQQPFYAPQPPQPPKKNSNVWLWIVGAVLLVFVLACGGLVWAVNSSNSPSTATTPSVATSQPSTSSTMTTSDSTPTMSDSTPTTSQGNSQASSGHYKPGAVVNVDGIWMVTINSVTTHGGDDFDKLKSGDIYLVADVTMKNVSNKEQVTSTLLDWTLRDSDGIRYSIDIFASFAPNSPEGKVESGMQIRGSLVYEVPTAKHNYTLGFTANFMENGQTIWDVSI